MVQVCLRDVHGRLLQTGQFLTQALPPLGCTFDRARQFLLQVSLAGHELGGLNLWQGGMLFPQHFQDDGRNFNWTYRWRCAYFFSQVDAHRFGQNHRPFIRACNY